MCTIAPSGDFGYQIVFPRHHITQETTSPVSGLLFSILFSAIKINGFRSSAESKNSRHDSISKLLLPNFPIVTGVTQHFNIPVFHEFGVTFFFFRYLLGIWHIRHYLPNARRALTAQLWNEPIFWLTWRFASYSLECLCTDIHFFRSRITPWSCSTASSTAINAMFL